MANRDSQTNPQPAILAYLLHIGFNFWSDHPQADELWGLEHVAARPYLRCEDNIWNELTQALADAGFNMVVLDLGDGVRYASHPEIAVEGAWSVARLADEIARLRDLGLEPIPKLNFSAAHDVWLGDYARMVSTPTYYQVCRDLIQETAELFGQPRLFHIGMDEETYEHQRYYRYSQVRQYDLWWEDLGFYIETVEAADSRAWVWSDYVWHHPDLFYAHMSQNVLQSNWYYGADFGDAIIPARAYRDLEDHGFEQVPTGSNWSTPTNFGQTVEYCRACVHPDRLLGFLQTVWRPTLPAYRQRHLDAIAQARAALTNLNRDA